MPLQNTVNFKAVKNANFHMKNYDIFVIFAKNLDCGYTLEPPHLYPCAPYFVYIKVKSMQRSGTEAIRIQIQPSKPKREITNITNSQNTKRTYGQPSEQLFPKLGLRGSILNKPRFEKTSLQGFQPGPT